MKPRRHEDSDVLEQVRCIPCLACGQQNPQEWLEAVDSNPGRSHPHHLVTRGHGGPDLPENILPLCVRHHSEIHTIGTVSMALKYPVIEEWLTSAGWVLDTQRIRWTPPDSVLQKMH